MEYKLEKLFKIAEQYHDVAIDAGLDSGVTELKGSKPIHIKVYLAAQDKNTCSIWLGATEVALYSDTIILPRGISRDEIDRIIIQSQEFLVRYKIKIERTKEQIRLAKIKQAREIIKRLEEDEK